MQVGTHIYSFEARGFTLIELLVVVAIIGMLSSVVLASLSSAREKARDARRLSDMRQLLIALELYYEDNGRYPASDADGCGSYDIGNKDYPFLGNLGGEYISNPPEDLTATGDCSGYRYFRYPAAYKGCDGPFMTLGVVDMETSGNPHPSSPGWACGTVDWHSEHEWVTGRYE